MQKNCLGYPVEIVEDAFGESSTVADVLAKACEGTDDPKVLIVADSNVVQRTEGLGSKIGRYVQEHGIRLAGSPVVFSGGEKLKTDGLQSVLKIVSAILEAKLGVNDCVLAIGGGSLLDVAGYAAAQTRGGVGVVRMPTTFAAMVDGAFASYAAVDSLSVKDALRVPCAPKATVIDPTFARTVLDGVWRGGFGEAVRLAAVCDSALMKRVGKLAAQYRERDYGTMVELLQAAVATRMKKGGTPFALWLAMRLESMSGYKLPHGYAVAIAICLECAYAVKKGYLKEAAKEAICGPLAACGALDGLAHSRYLMGQADSVLMGLDAWKLTTGSFEIALPAGLGKSVVEAEPDRALYQEVMKEFLSVPIGS